MYPGSIDRNLSNLMRFALSCMAISGSSNYSAHSHSQSQKLSPRGSCPKRGVTLEPRALFYAIVRTGVYSAAGPGCGEARGVYPERWREVQYRVVEGAVQGANRAK